MIKDLKYVIEGNTQDIIRYLVEDNKMSIEEAMDILYNSKTFELLNDLETHLYYESSAYIYELLKEELKK